MKNFAWYNSAEPKDHLFTFPETEDPDYRNTVTTIDSDGIIEIGKCTLTMAEVESLEGCVSRDDTQFAADLDYYGCNCDAARIGKRPNSLPPPVRE